MQVNLRCSE
nr:RecName: Full=Unknown protein 23 [Pseudotsuga menziesii]